MIFIFILALASFEPTTAAASLTDGEALLFIVDIVTIQKDLN